jgi:hypothetical protein
VLQEEKEEEEEEEVEEEEEKEEEGQACEGKFSVRNSYCTRPRQYVIFCSGPIVV